MLNLVSGRTLNVLRLVVGAQVLYETEDHAFCFACLFVDRRESGLRHITLIKCNIAMALEL